MRRILGGFEGSVDFVGSEGAPSSTIRAEEAGSGGVSVIGGLTARSATFGAEGLLMDLSDWARVRTWTSTRSTWSSGSWARTSSSTSPGCRRPT